MKALRQRSPEEGVSFHQKLEPRVYAGDEVQRNRIERSRDFLTACLDGRKGLRIIELGCGTMDISGPFSEDNDVWGVECNLAAAELAAARWPNARLNLGSLQPESCDVLVLCEFLEHIPEPHELVKAWLPLAEQVILSHPVNGDLTGDLSNGEHQWSYDEADFRNWFVSGGHELVAQEVFKMGGYDIIIGRGRRVA